MKGILLLLVLSTSPFISALEYSGVIASSGINSLIYGDATSFSSVNLKNWSYSSKSLSRYNFDIVNESELTPFSTQVKVRDNITNSTIYIRGDNFGFLNSFSIKESIESSIVHHGFFYSGNRLGMGVISGFSPILKSGFKCFLYKEIDLKLNLGWELNGEFLAMHNSVYTTPLYKVFVEGQAYNSLISLNNRVCTIKYNNIIYNYSDGTEYLNKLSCSFIELLLKPSFYIQWRKRSDSEFIYNLSVNRDIAFSTLGGSFKLRYINAPLFYSTVSGKINFGNGSYFSIKHSLELEGDVDQELEGLLNLKLLLTNVKVTCIIPLQSKEKKFSISGTISLN